MRDKFLQKSRSYILREHDKLVKALVKKLENNSRVLTQSNIDKTIKLFKKLRWDKASAETIASDLNRIITELDIKTENNNNRIEKMSYNYIKTFVKNLYFYNKNFTSKILEQKPIFDSVDYKAVEHVSKTSSFWIKDNLNKINTDISKKAQKIILDSIEKGLTPEKTAKILESKISGSYKKYQKNYFKVVASNAIARAQNYSEIMSYTQAGIKEYEYVAILDAATTPYCEMMNGRRFSVQETVNQIKEEIQMTPKEFLEKRPFVSQVKGKNSKVEYNVKINKEIINIGTEKGVDMNIVKGYNLQMPPNHHHCRSTIVPVI